MDDALLRSAGFTVGQSVSRKADETAAVVVSMSPERVTVQLEDGSRASVSAKSFLSGEWRVVKAKQQADAVQGWSSFLPPHNLDFLVSQWKGELLRRILEAHKNQDKHMHNSLNIFLKPKMVTVETKQAVHRLQILPLTCKLDVRPDAEASPNASAVCVGMTDLMGDTYKAWLLPMHVAPDPDKEDQRAFLHPFWLMKTTANEDEANMEMHPKGHGTRRLRLDGQWKLPVARNTAVLEPGDALLLHRPAAALQPEALIPETPSKKRKSS